MLLGIGRMTDLIHQTQRLRLHLLSAHLTTAHTAADFSTALEFLENILAQVGMLVPLHHMRGGNIADHAVHTAVWRNARFNICDQFDNYCKM